MHEAYDLRSKEKAVIITTMQRGREVVMIKRLARWLVAIIWVLGCTATTALAADDITGHWSEPYFRSLSAHGVINANGKGEFTPDTKISRAEFMRYINRAFGLTEEADISQYKDVKSNQWYYQSVRIAVKYGYISGMSETEMGPNREITREQAITILGRLCKVDAGDITPSQLPFQDKGKIASWSAPFIKWGADNGFMLGYTDGTFQPQRTITRAEAAKMLYFFTGTLFDEQNASYNNTALNQDTKNLTISAPCTLNGITVEGNLYISEGISQGTIVLNDVTVKGRLIAAGGAVQLNHVESPELYISSPFTGREITITSTGMTGIERVTAMSTTRLIQNQLQAGASGLHTIYVYGDKNAPVTLDGRFASVTLEDANRLVLTNGMYLQSLTCKDASTIEGTGTIQSARFEKAGAVCSVTPVTYTFQPGASATIEGTVVSIDRTQPNHTLTPATVNLSGPSDVIFAIVSDDRSPVRSVMLGNQVLQSNTQYIYDPVTGSIRILATTFQGMPSGSYTVQAVMSTGVNPTAVIYLGSSGSSGGSSGEQTTVPGSAILLTQSAQFSPTPGNAANQDVIISLAMDNSVIIQSVTLDGVQLEMSTQYTLNNNQVLLYKDAMTALTTGRTGTVTVGLTLSNGNQFHVPITLIV